MILEKAIEKLNNFKPQYYIIGVESNGKRGLPIQYEFTRNCANSIEEVYQIIKTMNDFKVYIIGNEYKSSEEIKNDYYKWNEDKSNEKDFEQYQKLKEKFEK